MTRRSDIRDLKRDLEELREDTAGDSGLDAGPIVITIDARGGSVDRSVEYPDGIEKADIDDEDIDGFNVHINYPDHSDEADTGQGGRA